MTSVAEYHQSVKARLITDPLVIRFQIRRERRTVDDGYLRASLTLNHGDQLEFSEYVRRTHDRVQVITYSHHWADSNGSLICRWDNAPHFLHLPRAPHHIHDGDDDHVLPGTPVTIVEVLDEIASRMASMDR